MQKTVHVSIKQFSLQVFKYFFHRPFLICYINNVYGSNMFFFCNSYVYNRSADILEALCIVIISIIKVIVFFHCLNTRFTSL